jgi:acyl carrier protein
VIDSGAGVVLGAAPGGGRRDPDRDQVRGAGGAAPREEATMKQMILDYIRNEYIDDDDDDMELNENTKLISGGIVDSFSMVSLKRFIEKKYAISIPDEEASPEAFDTVNSIIALVNRHLAKKG